MHSFQILPLQGTLHMDISATCVLWVPINCPTLRSTHMAVLPLLLSTFAQPALILWVTTTSTSSLLWNTDYSYMNSIWLDGRLGGPTHLSIPRFKVIYSDFFHDNPRPVALSRACFRRARLVSKSASFPCQQIIHQHDAGVWPRATMTDIYGTLKRKLLVRGISSHVLHYPSGASLHPVLIHLSEDQNGFHKWVPKWPALILVMA